MKTTIAHFEHDGSLRQDKRPDWTEQEEEALSLAGRFLREGELVAFPTETVYGLGGNALDPAAAGKIYRAKGRPSDNPLIIHIASVSELAGLAREIPEEAFLLAEAFWPGPLTMVLKKKPSVPDVTTGGLDTVAIRMPDSFVALEMIRKAGVPVAAPSANLSGRPSPTRGDHCVHDLSDKIAMILWGKNCKVGIESTIIDLTEDVPAVLRPGILTPTEIAKALGKEVILDPAILGVPGKDLRPRAPGMKYRHYAPKAPMTIYQGEEKKVREAIARRKEAEEGAGKKVGVIFFSDTAFEEAARNLFAELREMDDLGVDLILSGALKTTDERGFAVMNRMLKSAGYNVLDV